MAPALRPDEIAKRIQKIDPAFRAVVKVAGEPPLRRAGRVVDRFPSLIRSITFQLLATKAADTIHARVVESCGGLITPEAVAATSEEDLRSAGLSRTKASAMRELARAVLDGEVQIAKHGRMSDLEVIRDVSALRGIGPWTAQMYLMHTLARLDVWPVGDFGVRNGWSILHNDPTMITEKELAEAGKKFEGVRTDVAWYCWQAVHFLREAN